MGAEGRDDGLTCGAVVGQWWGGGRRGEKVGRGPVWGG
jgi:hypothetical protein